MQELVAQILELQFQKTRQVKKRMLKRGIRIGEYENGKKKKRGEQLQHMYHRKLKLPWRNVSLAIIDEIYFEMKK
ncbi:hypothetical protein V1478_010903 [Vespula squamosa]|uniref:Uncharacterized protein n=1 Tax=Vespula squamosa TaxID=30214 RepID=A0ABD2AFP0_VESSQ